MDSIQAGQHELTNKPQGSPADGEANPFRLADTNQPTKTKGGIWEGTVGPGVFRFAVYSLLAISFFVILTSPTKGRTSGLIALPCLLGAAAFAMIGWLSTFDRFKPKEKLRVANRENPFRKPDDTWPFVRAGLIAAGIMAVALIVVAVFGLVAL